MKKKGERTTEGKEEKPLNKFLQITDASLNTTAQIELNSNREAIVEGSIGILEYDETVVRLNTREYILKFSGRGLQIHSMTSDSVIVRGYIMSVEFIGI